jgi:RNA polymerase sigma-70 factor (ECF subfamily)
LKDSTTSLHLDRSGPATQFLLESVRAGDQAAWERIWRRYRTLLLVSLRLRMPHLASGSIDAEDVLQSAFISAWEEIQSFQYEGEGSFRRWLAQLVLNHYRNQLRGWRREQATIGSVHLESSDDEPAASSTDGPAAQAELHDAHEQILRAMSAMDEADQEILTMRIFEKLSWEEIAEVVGTARQTCSERYHAAIHRLNTLLG